MINFLKSPFVFVYRLSFGTFRLVRNSEMQILAGSLAFSTTISLVPLLAVTLSVFKAYGGLEILLKVIEPFILQNLVDVSGAQISALIRKAIQRIHSGTLGTTGAISLLFVSTKLFHDMDVAVQKVWGVKDKRPIYRRLPVYWCVMFLGPLLAAVALGIVGSRGLDVVAKVPKGVVGPAFAFFALGFLYKWMPAVKVRWRSALFCAMVAAVGVGLAQAFYAQLTKSILRYSKIYGSLASVPIFLLWILVLWWICLIGVAMCASLEGYAKKAKAN